MFLQFPFENLTIKKSALDHIKSQARGRLLFIIFCITASFNAAAIISCRPYRSRFHANPFDKFLCRSGELLLRVTVPPEAAPPTSFDMGSSANCSAIIPPAASSGSIGQLFPNLLIVLHGMSLLFSC